MSSQHRNGPINNGGSPQSGLMGNNNHDLDMMDMRGGGSMTAADVMGHQLHASSNQIIRWTEVADAENDGVSFVDAAWPLVNIRLNFTRRTFIHKLEEFYLIVVPRWSEQVGLRLFFGKRDSNLKKRNT